jgi:hypothetical protein
MQAKKMASSLRVKYLELIGTQFINKNSAKKLTSKLFGIPMFSISWVYKVLY